MSSKIDFSSVAASYDSAAALAREVGDRLGERLDCVKLSPLRYADIGCATGDGVRALMRRYPKGLPLAVDCARPMLRAVHSRAGRWARWRGQAPRCVNADVGALPLASASLDLVWSNLMLHCLPSPEALRSALGELHRVICEGGLLHFALLGPDTLMELRRATARVGLSWAGASFPDMHDIGDMLLETGFGAPVMEMEMLTLTYRTPGDFLADQRHLGVRELLLGARSWRDWRRIFAAWERADGRLPVRFEIVYGHAWKNPAKALPDDRAVMRFQGVSRRKASP